MIFLIMLLLLALAILLGLVGFKFRKKEWLRLIAGNNFNEQPKAAEDIAPFIGIVMYILSFFVLATALFTVYLYLL